MACAQCRATDKASTPSRHLAPLEFCGVECRDTYIGQTHRYRPCPNSDDHCLVPIGSAMAAAFRRWPELVADEHSSLEDCLHTDRRNYVLPRDLVQAIGVTLDEYRRMSAAQRAGLTPDERQALQRQLTPDERQALQRQLEADERAARLARRQAARAAENEEDVPPGKRAAASTSSASAAATTLSAAAGAVPLGPTSVNDLPAVPLYRIVMHLTPNSLVTMAGTHSGLRALIISKGTMREFFDSSGTPASANQDLEAFAARTAGLWEENDLSRAILDGYIEYAKRAAINNPIARITRAALSGFSAAFLLYAIRTAGAALDLREFIGDLELFAGNVQRIVFGQSDNPASRWHWAPLHAISIMRVLLDWRGPLGVMLPSHLLPKAGNVSNILTGPATSHRLTVPSLVVCGRWLLRCTKTPRSALNHALVGLTRNAVVTTEQCLALLNTTDGTARFHVELIATSPSDEFITAHLYANPVAYPHPASYVPTTISRALMQWRGPSGEFVRIDLLFPILVARFITIMTLPHVSERHGRFLLETITAYMDWRHPTLFCDALHPQITAAIGAVLHHDCSRPLLASIVGLCLITRPPTAAPFYLFEHALGCRLWTGGTDLSANLVSIIVASRVGTLNPHTFTLSANTAWRLIESKLLAYHTDLSGTLRVATSITEPSETLGTWIVKQSVRDVMARNNSFLGQLPYWPLYATANRRYMWYMLAALTLMAISQGTSARIRTALGLWGPGLNSVELALDDFVAFWAAKFAVTTGTADPAIVPGTITTNTFAADTLATLDDLFAHTLIIALARFYAERAYAIAAPGDLPKAGEISLVDAVRAASRP